MLEQLDSTAAQVQQALQLLMQAVVLFCWLHQLVPVSRAACESGASRPFFRLRKLSASSLEKETNMISQPSSIGYNLHGTACAATQLSIKIIPTFCYCDNAIYMTGIDHTTKSVSWHVMDRHGVSHGLCTGFVMC